MNECEATAVYGGPSLRQSLAQFAGRLRDGLRDILFRAAMALVEDGNILRYARREFLAAGYDPKDAEDGPNKWIQQNLLDLLRVMSMQGHSGSSAGYLTSAFAKLSRFEPLVPLSGDASEWVEVCKDEWQNRRCGRVFKDADGKAYDISGKVFREPDGCCFTSRDSRVYVEFPYIPKTEYVDVPKSRA